MIKLLDHDQARPKQMTASFHLRRWGLPLLIFLVAFIPRALSLNAFLTADEDDQLQFSARFLEAVSRHDWAGALVIGYPGVPTMGLGALGVWLQDQTDFIKSIPFLNSPLETKPVPFEPPQESDQRHSIFLPMLVGTTPAPEVEQTKTAAVAEKPLDYIPAVRLPLVFVYALALTIIFVALRHLINEPFALIATLMLAFDPFIMGHSRVIHVDAPLSYFMFASFLAFIIYLDKGGWVWLFASGVLGALGVLSKTPGVLLGPILLASCLSYAWLVASADDRRLRLKRFIVALGVWSVIAGVAFFLMWPSMWARPVYALRHIIENIISVMRFESHPTSGVFWGPTRSDRNPFYYLITIPFHLTPLSTVGLLAGLGMIIAGMRHRRQQIQSIAAQYLPFLLSLLAYDILFVAPISYVARRADRYILPVYFALDVMAAFGLWGLVIAIHKLWLAWRGQDRAVFQPNYSFALVSVALVVQIAFVGLHHPYYLTYFNPLFGGARTAPYLINVGWGEGLDQAAGYLNEKLDAADMTVAAWYSWQFAHYFEGHSVDLSSNNPAYTADYTVFYINQVQRGFPSRELLDYFGQRVPEKIVTLMGIDYAWIYPGPIVGWEVPADLSHLLNVSFQDSVLLAGFDIPGSVVSGHTFPMTLYWQTLAPLPGDFNVSIRIVDAEGRVWGQIDRFPIGGLIRTRSWVPDLVIRDEYLLTLEPGTPPGIYNFDILMYDYKTGQVFGQADHLGYITVLPPEAVKDTRATVAELPHPLDVELAPGLALVGHDWTLRETLVGQRHDLKLYWHALADLPVDYAVSVIARHESGREALLTTELIGPDAYQTSQWGRDQLLAEVYDLAFPIDAPAGHYELLARSDGADEVRLGQVTLSKPDRFFDLPEEIAGKIIPLKATLGTDIHLAGYHLTRTDERLDLTLYWFAEQVLEQDYTVFVHLVDGNGEIIAQRDSLPAAAERPTYTWLPGEFIPDHYSLPLSSENNSSENDILWVGMYDSITGERLPASSQSGFVSQGRIQIPFLRLSGP